MNKCYKSLTDFNTEKIKIVLKSMIVGLLAGIVAVCYRFTLQFAEVLADKGYAFVRGNVWYIIGAFAFAIVNALIVGSLVKWNPMISGSGIPQLEGIMKGYFKKRKKWFHTIWSKFLGGTLGIVSGLSLGREGPSIQIGAAIGEGVAGKIGNDSMEKKILMVSGASAGLAAAFNAPMAGVIFALEEIYKYFSPLILLSSMSAAVVADFVSKQVFGLKPVFDFQIIRGVPLNNYWIIILLGLFIGAMGAFYNYFLLFTKKLYKKFGPKNIQVRMLIPFLCATVIGLTFPIAMGGGHAIIKELNIHTAMSVLMIIFAVKIIFSMISFCAGTPGGIFFPLLVLGATLGAIFGGLSIKLGIINNDLFYNIIVLAMAGYFAAIVRAPITGIVLIMEMTGSFTHMLSLTVVSIIAYITADLLKCPPIYDALLDEMVEDEEDEKSTNNKKIMIEILVQHESAYENQLVKDISWPENSLLVEVRRGEIQLVPNGNTRLRSGDYLYILIEECEECDAKVKLNELNEFAV